MLQKVTKNVWIVFETLVMAAYIHEEDLQTVTNVHKGVGFYGWG